MEGSLLLIKLLMQQLRHHNAPLTQSTAGCVDSRPFSFIAANSKRGELFLLIVVASTRTEITNHNCSQKNCHPGVCIEHLQDGHLARHDDLLAISKKACCIVRKVATFLGVRSNFYFHCW
jgi:hypothetical protein